MSIVAGPTAGKVEVDSQTGRVAYLPGPDFVGLDKFVYQVRDRDGLSSNLATARIVVVDFENHPWRNPRNALDVNIDEQVSPIDALQIINVLNARGASELPIPPASHDLPPPLLDVTGDDRVSPLDALQVINYLNAGTSGEGEDDGTLVVGGRDFTGAPSAATGGLPSVRTSSTWAFDAASHVSTDIRASIPVRWSLAAGAGFETWVAGELLVDSAATSREAATLAPTPRMLRKRDRLTVTERPWNDLIFCDWPEQLVDVRFRF